MAVTSEFMHGLAIPRESSAAKVAAKATSPLLVLLMISILLPEELSFYIGTLRLTLARVLLILLTPALLFRFANLLSRPDYRFVASDLLAPLTGVWMLLSVGVMEGVEKAGTSAAILVVEFVLPYIAARVLAESEEAVIGFIRVMCGLIGLAALLAMLDPIYGDYVIHHAASRLTGYLPSFTGVLTDEQIIENNTRMGLLRASGTLPHPILLGTFCTIALLLSGVVKPRLRWLVRFCCLLGLIFSFTSAAIGGLLIGLGLAAYDRILARAPGRWGLLWGGAIAAYLLGACLVSNPIGFFLSHFTFDQESAYFRMLIWQYGWDSVVQSPIFGIGLNADWFREDWMPKSVDAVWLNAAMNFGIPAAFLLAATWLAPFVGQPKPKAPPSKEVGSLLKMMNFTIVAIIYIGFTVDYWGGSEMLICILVGLRANLGALAAKAKPLTA